MSLSEDRRQALESAQNWPLAACLLPVASRMRTSKSLHSFAPFDSRPVGKTGHRALTRRRQGMLDAAFVAMETEFFGSVGETAPLEGKQHRRGRHP